MTKIKIMRASLFGLFVLIFGISALIVSCGQQETITATTSTTNTTLASSATIALLGKLGSGTVSSAGIKSFVALSGYNVVAINNSTDQTYYASTNSNGNFSIDVPPDASYEISLIDSNSKYFGPMVMMGNASSSEVVMGITPSDDTDLGEIVVDSLKSIAQPTSEPSSIANLADKAEATNGVPKGAGNVGKQENSGITTRDGSDMDKDGIPNLFDADEDNDGIRNGIAAKPSSATVVSNTVESVWIDSNIWADHATAEDAKDIIHLRIHVAAKSGKLSEIASAEVVSVPATIKDVATIMDADSLGAPTNYPTEGDLWKTGGYALYKTTTLTPNQWVVSVVPRAIMNVGDIFIIRVHYTGGGYQDFFITTSYVLTDWAKIVSYNGNTMPTNEGIKEDAVEFSTSSLEVVFSKPLDEDGDILEGLHYSIIVGTCEGSAPFSVPTNNVETPVTDTGSSSLEVTISTVTAETYYICPVAESLDGQRNGEETWFTKQ